MEEHSIPVIIDCDTGIDDANALMMACASKKLQILAVTTVAGNTVVENATANSMNVLHLLGRDDIPVGRGASHPLVRALESAASVHGSDGLGGYRFAEPYTASLSPLPACALISHLLENADRPVTLIALGPATNIAALLLSRPDLHGKIERIVFMGTSDQQSLIRTFNVRVDPEAFRVCLNSGIPVYGIGRLLALQYAYITQDELEEIKQIGGPVADFVYRILSAYTDYHLVNGRKVIAMFDEATTAFVIDPSLFTLNRYYCDVDCTDGWTHGMTLIDFHQTLNKPEEEKNLYYVETADRARFVQLLFDSIRSYQA